MALCPPLPDLRPQNEQLHLALTIIQPRRRQAFALRFYLSLTLQKQEA
jgi:hypothetical protein